MNPDDPFGDNREPWWRPPPEGMFRGKPIIQPDFDKMEREIRARDRRQAKNLSADDSDPPDPAQ